MPHSPDVTHRGPQVQGTVCEGAVQPVLHTVAPGIGLMDARACLVVAQVVLALCISSCPVQVRTPGKERGDTGRLDLRTWGQPSAPTCSTSH